METNGISSEVIKQIVQFRDERNWKQFHNPKDLAISISLEAAELLELFQWSGEDCFVPEKRAEMLDELADILIYCVSMADRLDANIPEIMAAKLAKNAAKYPVDKAKGTAKKYDELD